MKYTGIIFQGWGVKAILEGRKTQTRRVIKPQPEDFDGENILWRGRWKPAGLVCPYGQVGDRLWVRETFALMIPAGASIHAERIPHYRADADTAPRWTPSIHMPRRFSRITLEITGVKVERIQDISLADIAAEGTPYNEPHDGPVDAVDFAYLWGSINTKRGYGWDANPQVRALTFKVVE